MPFSFNQIKVWLFIALNERGDGIALSVNQNG